MGRQRKSDRPRARGEMFQITAAGAAPAQAAEFFARLQVRNNAAELVVHLPERFADRFVDAVADRVVKIAARFVSRSVSDGAA
jgi:hypothetical protein